MTIICCPYCLSNDTRSLLDVTASMDDANTLFMHCPICGTDYATGLFTWHEIKTVDAGLVSQKLHEQSGQVGWTLVPQEQ